MKKKLVTLLIMAIIATSISVPVCAEDLIADDITMYEETGAAELITESEETMDETKEDALTDIQGDIDDENKEDLELLLEETDEEVCANETSALANTASQNAVIDSRKYNFSKLKISVEGKNQLYYTGRAVKPTITVENKGATKEILKEGVDYTVEYKNNIHAGTATAVVTGIGKYAWKKNVKKVKFRIKSKKIDKDKNNIRVSVSVNGNTEYKGKGIKPSVYVVDLDTGEMITSYNYKVSYKNNKNVRKKDDKNPPTARVTFRNDYSGKATVTFDILVAQLNDYNVTIKTADIKDNGKEITANNIKSKIKFRDYTLKRGKDYDISYTRDFNSYHQLYTVTFKGNFTGFATGSFNIYK